jgi:hypothetical protein
VVVWKKRRGFSGAHHGYERVAQWSSQASDEETRQWKREFDARRFEARRSRLEGTTECGRMQPRCGFLLSAQIGSGGEERWSADGGGAPSKRRLVIVGDTMGWLRFMRGDGEEVTTLHMLDSTARGRLTSRTGQRRRVAHQPAAVSFRRKKMMGMRVSGGPFWPARPKEDWAGTVEKQEKQEKLGRRKIGPKTILGHCRN